MNTAKTLVTQGDYAIALAYFTLTMDGFGDLVKQYAEEILSKDMLEADKTATEIYKLVDDVVNSGA